MFAIKFTLGFIGFVTVWALAEYAASLIPAWFGYLFLAALAIVPFTVVATKAIRGTL